MEQIGLIAYPKTLLWREATYCKNPKNSDTPKNCCNNLTIRIYHRVMCLNNADGMANSADPDQEQSDLGLHWMHRHVCLKTYNHYSTPYPQYMDHKLTFYPIWPHFYFRSSNI